MRTGYGTPPGPTNMPPGIPSGGRGAENLGSEPSAGGDFGGVGYRNGGPVRKPNRKMRRKMKSRRRPAFAKGGAVNPMLMSASLDSRSDNPAHYAEDREAISTRPADAPGAPDDYGYFEGGEVEDDDDDEEEEVAEAPVEEEPEQQAPPPAARQQAPAEDFESDEADLEGEAQPSDEEQPEGEAPPEEEGGGSGGGQAPTGYQQAPMEEGAEAAPPPQTGFDQAQPPPESNPLKEVLDWTRKALGVGEAKADTLPQAGAPHPSEDPAQTPPMNIPVPVSDPSAGQSGTTGPDQGTEVPAQPAQQTLPPEAEQGNAGQTIPAPPRPAAPPQPTGTESGAGDNKAIKDYVSGARALSQEEMTDLLDRTNLTNPNLGQEGAIHQAFKNLVDKGDIDTASKFVQGLRPSYDNVRALMMAATAQGDFTTAMQLAEKMSNLIPNGQNVRYQQAQDGRIMVTIQPDGSGQAQRTVLTPEQFTRFANGPLSLFDHMAEQGSAMNFSMLTGEQPKAGPPAPPARPAETSGGIMESIGSMVNPRGGPAIPAPMGVRGEAPGGAQVAQAGGTMSDADPQMPPVQQPPPRTGYNPPPMPGPKLGGGGPGRLEILPTGGPQPDPTGKPSWYNPERRGTTGYQPNPLQQFGTKYLGAAPATEPMLPEVAKKLGYNGQPTTPNAPPRPAPEQVPNTGGVTAAPAPAPTRPAPTGPSKWDKYVTTVGQRQAAMSQAQAPAQRQQGRLPEIRYGTQGGGARPATGYAQAPVSRITGVGESEQMRRLGATVHPSGFDPNGAPAYSTRRVPGAGPGLREQMGDPAFSDPNYKYPGGQQPVYPTTLPDGRIIPAQEKVNARTAQPDIGARPNDRYGPGRAADTTNVGGNMPAVGTPREQRQMIAGQQANRPAVTVGPEFRTPGQGGQPRQGGGQPRDPKGSIAHQAWRSYPLESQVRQRAALEVQLHRAAAARDTNQNTQSRADYRAQLNAQVRRDVSFMNNQARIESAQTRAAAGDLISRRRAFLQSPEGLAGGTMPMSAADKRLTNYINSVADRDGRRDWTQQATPPPGGVQQAPATAAAPAQTTTGQSPATQAAPITKTVKDVNGNPVTGYWDGKGWRKTKPVGGP